MGMKGHCQCGKVQFETSIDEPQAVYICHCLECRMQSSSAFGITFFFPVFDFPPKAKENMGVWSRITHEGNKKNCYFCKHCGSRISHHCEGTDSTSIRGGLIEGIKKEHLDNAIHVWTKRALVPIPETAEQYEEEPPQGY